MKMRFMLLQFAKIMLIVDEKQVCIYGYILYTYACISLI